MAGQIWCCSRNTELCFRRWDDGAVIFDDASGDLHALTPVASEVFALVLTRPSWTTNGLLEELLATSGSEEEIAMMETMLHQFVSLNLIERIEA